MSLNVLVTGANGFIGRNLVAELLQAGHQVTALVRQTPTPPLGNGNVKAVVGDLNHIESLLPAVENQSLIFHLAGAIAAKRTDDYYLVNAKGTENLLRAIRARNLGMQRLILVSSLAAAGPSKPGDVLTEESRGQPISDYGKSKRDAEDVVLAHSQSFSTLIVRPPLVYGPWDDLQLLPLFKLAKRGLSIYQRGETKLYSIIHAKDLVRGLIKLSECKLESGNIFYLANDKAHSWNEIMEALLLSMRAITLKIPVTPGILKLAAWFGEFKNCLPGRPSLMSLDKLKEVSASGWVCSSDKAKRVAQISNQYNLRDGMLHTAEWYREFGWL